MLLKLCGNILNVELPQKSHSLDTHLVCLLSLLYSHAHTHIIYITMYVYGYMVCNLKY